ncbi:DUF262 domain-containing protein [Curtobacterium flaccumfaciens]|uniref:DUF262 domain-containing protein n=1 Tax=Curtobacterium flaccumfaciens TaxID=2035 RepID=UPI001ADBC950|nr:DUF262 domain-containing protein [Curtobacterium flaccumfaciens]MBO9049686.1 DUF262 domain-containing protein [Curtobacterium flaccumfaciens pv. flaccumfaciens]
MADQSQGIELIPIESQTKTVQNCFQQCLYEVPNFQRPYSWIAEQLSDFWDDVVLAQGDFFFGSTVTWVSEKRDLFNDTYSIIDGQQRLTTSAIILSVIRDAFTQIAKDVGEGGSDGILALNQVRATQRYLITTDDDGREYPVLKRAEPMFYEIIQNPSALPSGAAWNNSAERIGEARQYFEGKILQELELPSFEERLERLKVIRANVLKARVIQVELASEEDGFLIFETLNTRGADLRLSDLIKNLLIRGGAATVADRQAIADRWDRLISKVQEGRISADVPDRFIWQSWNSRRRALKEPELFKAVGRYVGDDPTKHLVYLEELEVDAATYEHLQDENVKVQLRANGVRNAFAVPEFVDSVRALAIFDVSVANSTVMAIARKYAATNLVKISQVVEVMRLVENFHFQFNALTSSGSTGGTRSRYNRFALRLEEAQSRDEVAAAIADLKAKLKASLPSRLRTQAAFSQLFYAPDLALTQAQKLRARKIYITYILMAFAKHHKLLTAGQDLTAWTIEHLRPQVDGGDDVLDSVYSIGNLALLTGPLNNELGASGLKEKLTQLTGKNTYLDDELKSWRDAGLDAVTDEQVRARAEELASEALNVVWSL